MSKSTVVHARVNAELKENVESILEEVGLTASEAINLFFKQVELNNGLPFEIKVPEKVLAEKRAIVETGKENEDE